MEYKWCTRFRQIPQRLNKSQFYLFGAKTVFKFIVVVGFEE